MADYTSSSEEDSFNIAEIDCINVTWSRHKHAETKGGSAIFGKKCTTIPQYTCSKIVKCMILYEVWGFQNNSNQI